MSTAIQQLTLTGPSVKRGQSEQVANHELQEMEMEVDHTELKCSEVIREGNEVIASIAKCVERGPGKGKCHVFLDHSNICQCEDIDLTKERMR
jgi:hypothetical protein